MSSDDRCESSQESPSSQLKHKAIMLHQLSKEACLICLKCKKKGSVAGVTLATHAHHNLEQKAGSGGPDRASRIAKFRRPACLAWPGRISVPQAAPLTFQNEHHLHIA